MVQIYFPTYIKLDKTTNNNNNERKRRSRFNDFTVESTQRNESYRRRVVPKTCAHHNNHISYRAVARFDVYDVSITMSRHAV